MVKAQLFRTLALFKIWFRWLFLFNLIPNNWIQCRVWEQVKYGQKQCPVGKICERRLFCSSLAFSYVRQRFLVLSWLYLANRDLLIITGRCQDKVRLSMFLGNSLTCFHYCNNEVIYLLRRSGAEIICYSLESIVQLLT